MSTTFFNKLKEQEIIPKEFALKKSNLSIKSADNTPLKIRGKMKFPLIFSHPDNLNLKLKFGTFFIIDGLANSLNLGKPILDEISTVWDFTSNQIQIKDINIQLVENIEEENGGHIRSINYSPKPEKNIKLYNKKTTYLPPFSATYIRLKYSKVEDENINDIVEITPDPHFLNSKNVEIPHASLARKGMLITVITNPHSSGITLKQNITIAHANNPEKETLDILEKVKNQEQIEKKC